MRTIDLIKVQEIETEIVKNVFAICSRHDIPVFLLAGSALGAVRHGGPIPWDSDADLGMPYQYIDEFYKLAKEELDEKFNIVYCKYDRNCASLHPDIFAKGVDDRVLHVDVFPYVGLPDDIEEAKQHCRLIRNCFNNMHIRRYSYYGHRDQQSISMKLRRIKRFFTFVYNRNSAPPENEILAEYEELCSMYSFDDARYVSYPGSIYGDKEIILKDWLFPGKKIQYLSNTFIVPEKTNEYLNQLYGDYMQPPNDDRISELLKVKARIYKRYNKYWE